VPLPSRDLHLPYEFTVASFDFCWMVAASISKGGVRGFSKDPLGGGQQREKRFLVENLVIADSFRRRRAEPVSPASPVGMANAQKAHWACA
jgi:hypothetical protein